MVQRIGINNIQKSINDKLVIKLADFNIRAGEICALIGPNGVGKTTLIKCILGLMNPDHGSIEVNGEVYGPGNRAQLLGQFGVVLQYPSSISKLTIHQLFSEHFQYLELKGNPEKWQENLEDMGLKVGLKTEIGRLSLGMKQRLLLTLALSHNPNIIILDEPFNGLDIDGIVLVKERLKKLAINNVGILIASHSLPELEDLATHAVFMMNGETDKKKDVGEIMEKYSGGLHQYYQFLKGVKTI